MGSAENVPVENLTVFIRGSNNTDPTGDKAQVKPGGTVQWYASNAAYSLDLPTKGFPSVNGRVHVPKKTYSGQIRVTTQPGTYYYTCGVTDNDPEEDGQPSIIVTP